MIRLSVCMLAAALAGCAGTPPPSAAKAPTPVAAATPATRQVPVDANNVAEVQRAGYKVVNKEGKKLFCRTDLVTGSRVRSNTVCLTEEELAQQMRETQQAMSQVSSHQQGPTGK